jgi:hypothetical protein
MSKTPRISALTALTVAMLALSPAAANAVRSLSPTSLGFGNQTVGTTSAPKSTTLTVFCHTPTDCMSTTDSFSPQISVTPGFTQTNNCPATMTAMFPMTGPDPTCTINVTFAPITEGLIGGTLSTGAGGPTAHLSGGALPVENPSSSDTLPTGKKCKKAKHHSAQSAKKKKCKKKRK